MHTIVFLNILKPYSMTFLSFFLYFKESRSQTMDQMSRTLHQYLVFRTVNVLAITHNGEICKNKLIKHLNIFSTIRCTIYDFLCMACSLLIYPAFQSKVHLPGSFHSFLVFPIKFESLCANPNNLSERYL